MTRREPWQLWFLSGFCWVWGVEDDRRPWWPRAYWRWQCWWFLTGSSLASRSCTSARMHWDPRDAIWVWTNTIAPTCGFTASGNGFNLCWKVECRERRSPPVFVGQCVQWFLGVSFVDPLVLHCSSDTQPFVWLGLQQRHHKCCCTWDTDQTV